MSFKNFLIKALLWVFTPEHFEKPFSSYPNNFLIVSTTGLGDTIWSTPALRSLRQTYPDAHIAILTSEIGAKVLEHNQHIDEIFVLSGSTLFSLFRFYFSLKRRQFDAALIFHSSQRILLPFCALLKIPKIVGTFGMHKDLDSFLTHALEKKHQHEIERRFAIAKAVGTHINDYSLEMVVRKDEEKAVDRFLEGHGIPNHIPLIGLHPGAKNAFKQWTPKNFIEVGNRLHQHLGSQIFITGDHSEALLLLEIASKIPGAIPIAGELPLSVLTALIKRMSIFISNDTGPMHIAFAVGTPTVAIFGPTDPKICGPYYLKNVEVIAVPKTCTPCLKKNCQEPFCLLQIGSEQVYDAALRLFYTKKEAPLSVLI